MSEIVILVESVAGAGWLFFCALGLLAVGLLAIEPRAKTKSRPRESARPGARRAA